MNYDEASGHADANSNIAQRLMIQQLNSNSRTESK